MMFSGQNDQHIWTIGGGEDDTVWHPVPFWATWLNPQLETPDEDCGVGSPATLACDYPDLFCAGHAQLANGWIFVAGGNVSGRPAQGGLTNTYLFNPYDGDAGSFGAFPGAPAFGTDLATLPYGWAEPPEMTVDRWYPTLTMLPDGRVLIFSGTSRTEDAQDQVNNATRVIEIYDPLDSTDGLYGSIENINADFPDHAPPTYPYMFVLPTGDVVYVGGDRGDQSQGGLPVPGDNPAGAPDYFEGKILRADYNTGENQGFQWYSQRFQSQIPGGSAVMFAPGHILKAGGILDLSCTGFANPTDCYDAAEFLTTEDIPSDDPSDARSPSPGRTFQVLTVLPDSRVLMTGGNSQAAADGRSDNVDNPCDLDGGTGGDSAEIRHLECDPGEGDATQCPSVCNTTFGSCSVWARIDCSNAPCPAPATCTDGRCRIACVVDPGQTADGVCPDPPNSAACDADDNGNGFCNPANNQCYATRTPVIWDSTCATWSNLGPPENLDRMYHSTAQLLPDGRVLSTGTSGDGLTTHPNGQIYAPDYGGAAAPIIERAVDDDQLADEPFLAYGGSLMLEMDDAGGAPDKVVLVRLGTVTHAFNYDQRIITMAMQGSATVSVTWPPNTSAQCRPALELPENPTSPSQCSVAPPGNYMLFALRQGVPSEAVYIRVGDQSTISFLCEGGAGLEVTETSCAAEPLSGNCPSLANVTTSVPLPSVLNAIGQQTAGWHIVANPGMVQSSSTQTATEKAILEERCVKACKQEWSDNPNVTATCSAPGAFASPVPFARDVEPTLDLVRDQDQQGAGLFGSQVLACDLGGSCCQDFDEAACVASPRRVTQADDPLQGPEAYRVAFGPASKLTLTGTLGSVSTSLSGSVGYSFSRTSKAGGTGPFLLSSLNAVGASAVTMKIGCEDGTSEVHQLSAMSLQLAQPAFGIDEAGTDAVAFPIGGLLVESSFDVGTEHYRSRRPNQWPVFATARDAKFAAQGLQVILTLPCASGSTALVTAQFDLVDPGDGSALGQPPTASITTASPVACNGGSVELNAAVTDPDADLAEVRWYVDGVLMSPATNAVAFTEGHDIRVVARDARGAVATDERTIKCGP